MARGRESSMMIMQKTGHEEIELDSEQEDDYHDEQGEFCEDINAEISIGRGD